MDEDSDSSSYPEDFLRSRERLPSIVVEHMENNEFETKELPLQSFINRVEEAERESGADHTEGSDDGMQNDNAGMENSSFSRKSSVGSLSLLSLPMSLPVSPSVPEAVPPCLRS
ncbi:uncharacterized protein V6R79_022628 [Siganus canaliculatus]